MTKRDELLALAERCEKTSEGTFQLDEAIALTTGLYVRERRGKDRQEWFYPADGRGFGRRSIYPLSDLGTHRYTTSLDAAMTLVPERYAIDRLSWWPLVAKGHEDQRMCLITILAVDHEGFWTRGRYKSAASTPALALCAAALRAQAEMEG